MKKVFYSIGLIFVSIFCFNSCIYESNSITLLDYISKEYIFDYFPYEEGQVLMFVNEDKSDSCSFIIVEKNEAYRLLNDISYFGSMSYGYNDVGVLVCLENTDSLPYRYSFNLGAYHYANNPECNCFWGVDYRSNEFGDGCGLEGNSYGDAFNISMEDIDSFFTPVFIAYDKDNSTEEYAKFANGSGIVMFTDYYGTKWYFDSVLSE